MLLLQIAQCSEKCGVLFFFLRFLTSRKEQSCCPGRPLLDFRVDPTVAFPFPTVTRWLCQTKDEMENTR